MPRLLANHSRWMWVGRIFLAGYIGLFAAAIWLDGNVGKDFLPLVAVLGPMFNLLNAGRYDGGYVLLDDVLAFPGNGAGIRYVPLAVAEVKKGWFGWTFRWKEGRRNQVVRTFIASAGQGPVAAAMAAEHHHPAKTAKEAASRLRVAVIPKTHRWLIAWMVLACVAVVTGFWLLRTPIPMAVLAVLALFLPLGESPDVLAWTGETLWVLRHKAEPYAIPLEKVTEMRTSRAKGSRIFTTDPAYPVIRFYAYDTDFQKAFERRLAGEPEPAPPTPTDAPVLRCSLCGTPAPGHVPAVGAGVYICESCANRARLEASESGHGLAPKDPKPM